MNKTSIAIGICVPLFVALGLILFVSTRDEEGEDVLEPEASDEVEVEDEASGVGTADEIQDEGEAEVPTKLVDTANIEGAASAFRFIAQIPGSWEVQVVPEIEALSFFEPSAGGEENLEKSQIFVRYFEASSFLTLSTVDILEQEDLTINTRPAVRYLIQKKSGLADFPSQPQWRNEEHTVTDIRVSDTNPSIFYVVAKRPDLDDQIYQEFLDSIQ